VLTPVGQVFVWQRRAWMQPSENMKPRAVLTKSAPAASAQATRAGVTSLTGRNQPNPFLEPTRDQRVDDQRQRFVDRQRHMIGQRLRCGTTAALAAIDGQKVGRRLQTTPGDRRSEFKHEAITTDGGLDAYRLAGHFPNLLDLVEQFVDVGDILVTVRAHRIATLGNAANAGDLGRDLVAEQNATLARLGSLRKLDLEGPHRCVRRQFAQAYLRQFAVLVPNTVFRGSDLKNDVATTLQMIRRQSALTGIKPAASRRAAPRDNARTAGREMAPKLIALMFTSDLQTKGVRQ
jgi:hypothetical protein